MSRQIVFKRRKPEIVSCSVDVLRRKEEWASFWRSNIHRFLTEYLGLDFQADFQAPLIYYMDRQPNFIYAASRGLAKSTMTLLYALARCILYPGTVVIIVAPLKSQSADFIQKAKEFAKQSPNLLSEIEEGLDGIRTGQNKAGISFLNGSEIIAKTFSEGSRGKRGTILIVDEFAMIKNKKIITGTFVPMLTAPRKPPYKGLTKLQRQQIQEPTRQLYLSSIRTDAEWSWEYFVTYINYIIGGSKDYGALALSYHLGVEGGYILRSNVEQVFRENPEQRDFLTAEYCAIPIRGSSNSFFKFTDFDKCRDHTSVLVAKSDEEYINLAKAPEKWAFYLPKKPNEIRILTMDVALIESPKNDNTQFVILSLVPNGGKYYKSLLYQESMHGLNTIVQAERAKQLFYEMDCYLFCIDSAGAGRGVADVLMKETYDEKRGISYPAWTSAEPEDTKTSNRSLDKNAVPIMYAIKTTSKDKHNRFVTTRDILSAGELHLPVTDLEAIDYFAKKYNYYRIEDDDLRSRILMTFVQTNLLVYEAINLETVIQNGMFNLVEKSSRRKDRVMALCYAVDLAKMKEEEYIASQQESDDDLLSFILSA